MLIGKRHTKKAADAIVANLERPLIEWQAGLNGRSKAHEHPRSTRPFSIGNPGSPGRPSVLAEKEYANAIRRGAPPSKIVKIMKGLVDRAIAGNDVAAAIVLKFVLPDPARAYSTLDAEQNRPLRIAGRPSREAFKTRD